MYIAEILIAGRDLTARMSNMRAWLDHQRCEPYTFRLSHSGQQRRLRVSFKDEQEAVAFAEEFGGTMSRMPDTDAVMA